MSQRLLPPETSDPKKPQGIEGLAKREISDRGQKSSSEWRTCKNYSLIYAK